MIRKIVNAYFPKNDWFEINMLLGDDWTSLYLKWNSLGNWVVLIFSGQKPCTRIISSILHSFSHFSRAINVIVSCIIKLRRKDSLCWSPRKRKTNYKASHFTKWSVSNDEFTCTVFSQLVWNLKLEIVFGAFTDNLLHL